jgi:ech hydrogenase subunit A
LIFFHGISKCMLFLNAGVLEKEFHFKQVSDMDRLAETGPFTSFVITIGFMSLLLPPFGAFVGKWFSLETMGSLATHQKILGAFVITAIACGGALLSLLYFKVLGLLIARTGDRESPDLEVSRPFYRGIMWILLALIVLSVLGYPFLMTGYFAPVAAQTLGAPISVYTSGWSLHIASMTLPIVPLLVAFFLLPVTIIMGMFIRFKNVDRVKEYMCGEKIEYSFSSLSFSTDKAMPYFSVVGIILFVALLVAAML